MRIRIACRGGFTLIEVLVVVAIIALLVSILLPTLSRARAQARMMVCQGNLHQLGRAFISYSVDTRGRLPGNIGDEYADWLGGVNGPVAERVYGTSMDINKGKQPEWGTIFKKHMGSQKYAYTCPDHIERPVGLDQNEWYFSYTANLLLSGAKPEMLAGAHYRRSTTVTDNNNFSTTNHTANMRPFEGVPMIVEEDYERNLKARFDGGWANTDGLSDRHPSASGSQGRGGIAYHDGHVGAVSLPAKPANPMQINVYFQSNSMCVRTTGNKWISGTSFASDQPRSGGSSPTLVYWGYMDRARVSSSVSH